MWFFYSKSINFSKITAYFQTWGKSRIQHIYVIHKGCSKANASNFIMLAHKIRGRSWWDGIRDGIFPPIFYYVLLSCDNRRVKLDKMKSDVEVYMKQRFVIEFLHVEKMALITIHLCLLNIYRDQTVNVSTVKQWVLHFSSGNSDVKDEPCSRWPCTAVTPLNEEHLNQLIWANRGLQPGNCVQSWISASVLWKQWWQHWNITKFVLSGSHKCSQRNRKNTICKLVRTYWTNMRPKVIVSWIASLLATRHSITTSWS